uniref:Uncharacterized protein n=1 Tax=Tanacetum cinerariifolium TaxID=118510 RepID=A0A6L2L2G3_TANCI|nr:hypothetical protein [Tanacetum cinerariifolium]
MIVRVQPAMSLSHSARVIEAMALSDLAFYKRYRSSYKTPSPSLTLPVRKRYRGTFELILDIDSEGDDLGDEEDESSDADDEKEIVRAVLVVETAASEPLGLEYGALRRCELAVEEDQVPSTFEVGQSFRVYTDISAYAPPAAPVQTHSSPEWSLGSLLVLPSYLVVPTPIA